MSLQGKMTYGGREWFCSLPFAEAYHGNVEVQRRVPTNLMDWWDSYFSARSKLCKKSQKEKKKNLRQW